MRVCGIGTTRATIQGVLKWFILNSGGREGAFSGFQNNIQYFILYNIQKSTKTYVIIVVIDYLINIDWDTNKNLFTNGIVADAFIIKKAFYIPNLYF